MNNNDFREESNGQVIYLPTGEDVTQMVDSTWNWFGAAFGLHRLVDNDEVRIPYVGWSGSIYDLARFMRLEVEVVAEQFGHSVEAFDALEIMLRRT